MIRYTHRLAFIQMIRRALLERAATLTHTIDAERDELGEQRQAEDLGREPSDEERTVALLQLGDTELEQVNHALDLIDLGTYGTCEACGRDIPNERLIALPLATRCVACARAREVG